MELTGSLSYVKQVLHCLVVSAPCQLTVEQLNRDYSKEEGGPIPYHKLGFRDLDSFLRSIPETLTLMGYGPMAVILATANKKSAHIQELVQCQKKPTKAKNQKSKFIFPSQRSDLVFLNEKKSLYNQGNYTNFNNNKSQYAYTATQPVAPRPQIAKNFTNNTNTIIKSFSSMKIVPVQSSPNEERVPMRYEKRTTENQVNNFPIKKPVQLEKPKVPSKVTTFNKAGPTPAKQIHISSIKKPVQKEDTKLTNQVTTVTYKQAAEYVSSDEGCDEDAIPSYAVDERVLNCNFSNKLSDAALRHIDNDKPLRRIENDKPLANREPVVEYVSSDEGNSADAVPLYAFNENIFRVEYPHDAVQHDYEFPSRNVKDFIKLNEQIEVQLVMVENPSSFNFWVYDKEYNKYKIMSDNMQNYYTSFDDAQYTIPLVLIMPGQLGAYYTKNKIWHRVRVLTIRAGFCNSIEVLFIDTGERIWINHRELKYLCKNFAELPPQCWPGRLACITYREGTQFSAPVCHYFYDIVSYRRVFAQVEKIDETTNTVALILVDPNSKGGQPNINKALIESGWVRRCLKP